MTVAELAPGGGAGTQPDAAGLRRPGRPRSGQAGQAIIDAALELFAESGPEGLCIEQVAARAGVGKATIYRRWPGKEDLLLDALATLKAPLPEPLGVSVRDDLVALVRAVYAEAGGRYGGREFAMLIGEYPKYSRLMARYRETVVEPRREVFRTVLRRGAATGELRADTDLDAALFMLVGAVVVRSKHDSIPPDYPERVVDELLRGLTPRDPEVSQAGQPGS
ncbi:MAG TPA: TetR/AcrR family transcriptional regulator [Streptosporangiaceae bacterium]|nr:TetR/AcrR family transcriptional regulator [Streptosporangiaceae bacterium]